MVIVVSHNTGAACDAPKLLYMMMCIVSSVLLGGETSSFWIECFIRGAVTWKACRHLVSGFLQDDCADGGFFCCPTVMPAWRPLYRGMRKGCILRRLRLFAVAFFVPEIGLGRRCG